MHRSLEAYGLNKEATVLLGGCCLACLGIRYPHDIDAMVVSTAFNMMRHTYRTPGGQSLREKLHTHQPWLESYPPRRGLLSLDLTRPTLDNIPDEEIDNRFLASIAELPRTTEGWHYLTAELSLEALESFHVRKHREDIKQLKTKVSSSR